MKMQEIQQQHTKLELAKLAEVIMAHRAAKIGSRQSCEKLGISTSMYYRLLGRVEREMLRAELGDPGRVFIEFYESRRRDIQRALTKYEETRNSKWLDLKTRLEDSLFDRMCRVGYLPSKPDVLLQVNQNTLNSYDLTDTLREINEHKRERAAIVTQAAKEGTG